MKILKSTVEDYLPGQHQTSCKGNYIQGCPQVYPKGTLIIAHPGTCQLPMITVLLKLLRIFTGLGWRDAFLPLLNFRHFAFSKSRSKRESYQTKQNKRLFIYTNTAQNCFLWCLISYLVRWTSIKCHNTFIRICEDFFFLYTTEHSFHFFFLNKLNQTDSSNLSWFHLSRNILAVFSCYSSHFEEIFKSTRTEISTIIIFIVGDYCHGISRSFCNLF